MRARSMGAQDQFRGEAASATTPSCIIAPRGQRQPPRPAIASDRAWYPRAVSGVPLASTPAGSRVRLRPGVAVVPRLSKVAYAADDLVPVEDDEVRISIGPPADDYQGADAGRRAPGRHRNLMIGVQTGAGGVQRRKHS